MTRARIRTSDPAMRLMADAIREPQWTIAADCSMDEALDKFFLPGESVLFVASGRQVLGMVTAEDVAQYLHARSELVEHRAPGREAVSVGDLMIASSDIPVISWETVQETRVADLLEIFAGAGVDHLVVIETGPGAQAQVRGVIHRRSVERSLRVAGVAGGRAAERVRGP
jgi:CBS domain-containing protein